MNRNQVNQVRMHFAVDRVLDQSADKFSTLTPLVDAHATLKDKLGLIGTYRQIQELDNSGLTAEKRELRNKLLTSILRLSSALKAHATVSHDTGLLQKCHYTPAELQHKSDPLLSDVALLLYGLASPRLEALSVFFFTQTELDELSGLIEEFKQSIPNKRVATSLSKVSTHNINATVKEINYLLKHTIDVLMAPYQYVDTDFYASYKNARIVVDYRGSGSKVTEELKVESE